ncbi:metallophosphoesterase [Desulfobacter vibrioformis]|uniref:metallophosphoesterase n=1 Tax=Desulfobacter vibrioformis TaxID=34031 RepID=UPI001470579A|nr:metallophosphoesterase [Desulfobacter vibrioformis]
MFLITAVLVIGLIYGFFGFRIINTLPLGTGWKTGLWTMLVSCFAVLVLAVMTRYRLPDHWITPSLFWVAYICLGFMTLIFPGILLKDACMGAYYLIHNLFSKNGKQNRDNRESKAGGMDPSRRIFLTNAGNAALTGAAMVLTGYGVNRATREPDVIRVDVPIKGLPDPFRGFTILQISDLHISMTLKEKYVRKVVNRASREQADMIVFTGDMADGHEKDMGKDASPLSDLDAPFGKYFVTGNHDYYSGALSWLNKIERLGFIPLINEHRIVEKENAQIVLAGITDYRAGRIMPGHASDPGKALKGAPLSMPRIMLAHQPKSIFKTDSLGLDLMICGHTHGGQYIPWNCLVRLDQPYVHGLHRHNATQVYVSRGTGYWGPPLRIGAPPEITVLRLVNGSPA